jgi:hypothetical protein
MVMVVYSLQLQLLISLLLAYPSGIVFLKLGLFPSIYQLR